VSSGSCTGSFPSDRASLVSAFELAGVSDKDPALTGTGFESGDLKYAGIQYDSANGLLIFAIATWERWATPNQTSFTIVVDGNDDGTDDRVLMNPRFYSGGVPVDVFLGATGNYAQGASVSSNYYVDLLSPATVDTSLWSSDVLMLAATSADLGVTPGQPFRWRVVSCPGSSSFCGFPPSPTPLDSMGPFTWNTAAPGLDFGGAWALDDQPGNTIPVAWNVANLTADGSPGALLLHHHNATGTRAEPVPVQTDAVLPPDSADLAVGLDLPVVLIEPATDATFKVSVSNLGSSTASGLAVHVPIPAGLTHVSHAGAGSYDPASGVWSIGTLATSSSVALDVTVEGGESGLYTLLAEVAAGTPIDPKPGNNRASALLTVREKDETAPGGYFTLRPCRVIDTRMAPDGTWSGPALVAQAERLFPIAGRCGVPPTATAIAANLAVTGATGNGHLRVYAAGTPTPGTSTLNFSAGATRANNAIVGLGAGGQIAVFTGMASGTVHLILDVAGYFE
jgi:uncharacterized repeat protein (TIGR01451 family)